MSVHQRFSEAVRYLYPDVPPRTGFRVDDDGSGPALVEWTLSDDPPTEAQILAALAALDSAPPPVPASISDRQFFQQLAIESTITQAQALAAVKVGTIPPVLQGFVDSIADPAQRFAANMLLAGATVFERAHPMTEAIRVAQGRTHEQTDDFFRAASAL